MSLLLASLARPLASLAPPGQIGCRKSGHPRHPGSLPSFLVNTVASRASRAKRGEAVGGVKLIENYSKKPKRLTKNPPGGLLGLLGPSGGLLGATSNTPE